MFVGEHPSITGPALDSSSVVEWGTCTVEDTADGGSPGGRAVADNPTAFAGPPGPVMDEIRREAEKVHEAATYASETQFEYAKNWRRVRCRAPNASVNRWRWTVA